MLKLQEKNPEKYQKHFSKYIADGITPDNLADKYEDVHRKIRQDPSAAPKKKIDLNKMKLFPKRPKKKSLEERRQRRIEKINQLQNVADEENENKMEVEENKEE